MSQIGANAVGRPTVLIISDQADFSRAISTRWQTERNSPSFLLNGSDSCDQLPDQSFDLAIVGGIDERIGSVLDVLRACRKPVLHVSHLNGKSPKLEGVVNIPEIEDWPELAVTVGKQVLQRESIAADLAKISEAKTQLEREASLGRYILEMRHNLNNTLTSILGNSELMLLDPESLSPGLRLQVETIRNMGMRMNEIMQRFSSLQKEMQLVEQQSWNKAAKGVGAGV